jgi:hypothetical protein
MDAVASGAHLLMRLRWLCSPLPAPLMKHGAALRAKCGFRQFVLGFIGVVPIFLSPNMAIRTGGLETCEPIFHFVLLNLWFSGLKE